MIVMDLEWNRGYDRKKLDEVLQIGAVRIDRPGGAVRDTFCAYIAPRVHKRFDPGARKLPDLRDSLDSTLTFAEAWTAFTAWCGGEREFAFWGPDDFGVIRQSCAYWGVACFEPERVFNFQRAFSHACGAGSTMLALWRAIDYLGVPDVFDFHNALYDALYTALVGEWLREEDLAYAPPAREKKPPRRRKRRLRPPSAAGKAPAAAEAAGPQEGASGQKPKQKRKRRRRRRRKVDIKTDAAAT